MIGDTVVQIMHYNVHETRRFPYFLNRILKSSHERSRVLCPNVNMNFK